MPIVLVTGATGFIGRHALAPLADLGFDVHAVTSRAVLETRAPVRWHTADLLDRNQVSDLIAETRPSHLLHFAWYTSPGLYWAAAENFDWVAASTVLLREFALAGGRRAVMAGTCAEYGRRDETLSEQNTPAAPSTVYGTCKHATQILLGAYPGLSTAWGRIFYLYGPHEKPERFVPYVIRSLLHGEQALCGDPSHERDYLFVEDVGSAFAALLASDTTGPVNIGSGRATSVQELAQQIAECVGHGELVCLDARPALACEPERVVADVGRLEKEVGWTPSFNLRQGIEITAGWWAENL